MSELIFRAATFAPSSFNAETGTVDAVLSTGADVVRRDYQGEYLERLPVRAGAWTAARQPIPVLRDHQRNTTALVGAGEHLRIESGTVLSTIRLSDRPDLAGFRRDVETGIVSGVSIGYAVPSWTESTESGRRVKTADSIIVHEISFTPTPADAGAGIRSLGDNMELETQIRSIAEAVGVPATFADGLIQRNVNLEDARTAIIREAARNVPQIDQRQPAFSTRETSPDDLARAAGEALYVRVNPSHQAPELARPWVGRRVADIARELLRQRGLNTLGSDAEIIDRSLTTTSDLANVVGVLANKVLAAAYQTAPGGLKTVCKRGTPHPNFKGKNLIRRGELPTLEKVNEHGEFKRGSIVDDKQTYAVDTFGKVFGMSRRLLIDDDLGALADIAAGWSLAASEFENGFLVDLLTSNSGGGPKLADNVNLFHSTHGNLAGSGAVISDTTLSAARLALRSMKGLNGVIPINATAKYLVVPAALETTAEKYLASLYPAQASNVNPFSGKLDLIVDPRLDAESVTRWYLFCDPAVLPVIEYAYLAGYEGVQVETRNGFDIDGVEIRARLDFGAGGVDHRGAYCNAGA